MGSPLPAYVFAKAPVAGRVKTRLIPAVGAEGAARLATALLEDTLEALVADGRAAPVLAVDDASAFQGRGLPLVEQGQGDLGERLERVLSRGLARVPAVVAVGSDTPGLPSALLEESFSALQRADAVLAPAEDGGFVLIGLRRCPPALLRGLPWSGPQTLLATEARLRARGLSVTRTRRFFDVDGPADLARLRVELSEGILQARHTAEVLGTLAIKPWLSVVMPVLDEALRLEPVLRRLVGLPAVDEVLVVDGGSKDGTRALAQSIAGVRLLDAPRGRARQMNAGAAAARGEVLCFLHADVTLPRDAVGHVARALALEAVVACAFRTRTVDEGGRSWASAFLPVADLRSRWTHLPYGDQAMCVRRSAFERVGGFPDQSLMEDVELARRLSALGQMARLRPKVMVSGRRFLQRPLRTLLFWNTFPALYRLGVRTSVLEKLYGMVR
jgi:rSAM/selenodomain-associated transferase 2/rSAM/selenodomain-associated transferase 1